VIMGILGDILGDDIGLTEVLSSASSFRGARKACFSLFSLALQLLIVATSRVYDRRGKAVARPCFVGREEALTFRRACEGEPAILMLVVGP